MYNVELQTNRNIHIRSRRQASPEKKKSNANTQTADTSNAATKGDRKEDKGQRKGYGQCWECGEYGHPRRGCKAYLERMGKRQKQDISALDGAGKNGKGGQWGKGTGTGAKGKGYYGGKGQQGYRFLGKV